MQNQRKILVIGASSFLGKFLLKELPLRTVGTYCKTAVEDMLFFDSLSMDISLILKTHDFSHAVILMGDTQPDSCVSDIKASCELNVTSIKRIIDSLNRYNVIPVFTSSEFVFDGEDGNYSEASIPDPILVYGQQKLEIEEYIKQGCNKFTILRLAKIYGLTPGDKTIFTSWLDKIINGCSQFKCAADQRFSPVFVDDVVDIIIKAIDNNIYGLYHLGGPKPCTRIELLQMLLKEIKPHICREIMVEPCRINDFILPEKRPVDVSLCTSEIVKATGIKLHDPAWSVKAITDNYFGFHSASAEG